ncbi:MAG: hypothetical protein ACYTGZ_05305 [Planctomycetota bacterium]
MLEADPLLCPDCQVEMKIVSVITDPVVACHAVALAEAGRRDPAACRAGRGTRPARAARLAGGVTGALPDTDAASSATPCAPPAPDPAKTARNRSRTTTLGAAARRPGHACGVSAGSDSHPRGPPEGDPG